MGTGKTYSTQYLLDSNNNTGSTNQVLVSTATGIDWVDGSGSGIIGGPYLPLSAGSSYPLTGDLFFDGSGEISSNTVDGADNAQIIISGAGASGDTRGASVHLAGNENGNGGLLQLRAGDGSVGGIRLYEGGSERMRIAAGNTIIRTSTSIGTTVSPTRTLDVRGTGLNIFGSGGNTELMLRGQVEGTGTVRNLGAWHWSVRSDVGGDNDDLKLLRFITGTFNGTAMQISNSNGSIAIGTNITPSANYKLDIITSVDQQIPLRIKNSDADSSTFMRFEDNDGQYWDTGINYANNDYYLKYGGTVTARFTNAGGLDVYGTGNSILTLNPGTTAGNYSALNVGRTDGAGTAHVTPAVTGGVPIGGIAGILFGSTNTSLPAVAIQTPNSASGHIVFKPKGAEMVRIQADGNVGIGVTGPSEKLQVNQTNNDIYQLTLHNTHLSTTAKTRIGNWASQTKISSNYMQFGGTKTQDDTAKASWVQTMGDSSSSYDFFDISRSPAASTTLSSLMQINGSGDVGIGTTPEVAGPTWRTLFVGSTAAIVSRQSASGYDSIFANNYYVNASNADQVRVAAPSSRMFLDGGTIRFQNSPLNSPAPVWSERLRINENGNVGVGITTNLDVPFTVQSNGSAGTINLIGRSNGVYDESMIGFYDYDQTTRKGYILNSAGNMYFATGGSTEHMTIDSAGSVAIGTFTPSGTPTGDYRSLEIGRQGNTITGAPWKSNLYFSTNATITAGSTAFTARYLSELPMKMVMEDGIFTWSNAVAPTAVGDTVSFNERMRINVAGDVGIFATNPGARLEVKAGNTYTSNTDKGIKITNAGHRGSELNTFGNDAAYLTQYFENYAGGNGRAYDRVLEIVCKGAPDGTYGEGVIKFKVNPINLNSDVTEVMRITGSRKVGIGTSSPGATLDVQNSGNYESIRIQNTQAADTNKQAGITSLNYIGNSTSIFQYATNNGANAVYYGSADGSFRGLTQHSFMISSGPDTLSHAQPLKLTAAKVTMAADVTMTGSVGIGETTLQRKFNLYDGTDTWTRVRCGASAADWLHGIAGSDTAYKWYNQQGGVYAMQITATATPTLTVKGDIIAYGSPSDKRLKENIKPIESALDKVSKLQGVTFDWKESDSILDIKEDIGFIAQDVQKVIPELVRENEDGMLSMRHQGIAPILLEAIKELKAEIDLLKSKPCTCNNCNCNI